MATATYDPSDTVIVWAGIPITGYTDGTYLLVERNEDAFTLKIGAAGEAARTRNRNQSGKATCTLMQSALANDLLSAIQTLDELTGAGIGPLFVKDLGGLMTAVAENAWVMKPPNIERGKELADTEWVLECESVIMFNAGTLT